MEKYIDAALLKDMLLCADAAISSNVRLVNELNVFPVPDGDTGTNMSLTFNTAAAELRKKNFDRVDKVADCAASARRTRKFRRYFVAAVQGTCEKTEGH